MSAIPDFLIIGAQKAGTTAAARNLNLHPELRVFSGTTEYGQKEIEFFNQHWDRGIAWYSSHFQESSSLNGEKTAELLHRTACHGRMFLTNPKFKLIVLLRSPTARAYSQWKMAALVKRDEIDGFDFAVRRELERLQHPTWKPDFEACVVRGVSGWREGYVQKGMYAEQLMSLWEFFPRDQVIVGISERIRRHPTEEYGKIFDFLGVERVELPFADHFVGHPYSVMSADIHSVLTRVYDEPNSKLSTLLDDPIPEWEGENVLPLLR